MRHHFDSLLDSKGYLIRDFTREERLWILIESTVCKHDFLYFATNYAKIVDWTARVVTFQPNVAQQIVLDLIAQHEELRWAFNAMFLKARRLGLTTVSQILLAYRTFFWPNVGAYTGSAEETKSREMVKMIDFIWNNMPYWLRPRKTAHQAGEFMEFADLNSSVVVQWGNQKQGIGRGATPVVAHLSEVSTFTKPEELIDAALAKAILENPFGMLLMESTANVIGDYWHKTWNFMVSQDSRGLARYKPIFLPWYVGTDLYPTEAGYRRRPAPSDWVPPAYVDKHAEAAKVYVRSTKVLRDALGANWEMSLKQKWWYYLEFEEARAKKQLHILLRELPANAEEAFQNANPSVVSTETMIEIRTRTNYSVPVGAFQFNSPDVPFIYRDMRVVGDPIAGRAYSNEGVPLDNFSLEPVEMDGWPDSDPDLKTYIWEWPIEGETYGVYCDPSEGVELDSSVCGVIKKATPFHPDEQVVEWASNKVAPHDLWAFVYYLCHLYTVRSWGGDWQEPLAVIETNIIGDTVQTEMRKRGYGNFYRQMDFTMVGDVGPQFNKRPRAVRDKIGWKTDRVTRPKMISLFRKLVRDGNFIIRSPWLVNEVGTLQYNIDKARIEAAEGHHDDRVMGPAMLLAAWYDPEVYGTVPTAYIEQKSFEANLDRMPSYQGDVQMGRASRYVVPALPQGDSRRLYG
jgi:hypothetical protein